ncbi:NADPH-dependent FMN reductase [Xanthomonas vasicola]|uniref:NADPH-dependent FMN reductase n=1 Tax=Xanthomonas vasicola TaxID=56459 RepID=UPI0001CC0AB3|nr:NADPH-dependent FMN reductase [Xanthomonas vasicola]KFA24702.1 NADPH-dependent FMN reductase [Xanthomonas vasicola pv. musacearum NCPPB 4384]AZR31529.1 NAD(P)H-dependent oxidoreductase [Xanthomonas vasicola pv. musacearum NCPPB 4379]KFA06248.1 NADPH-dependent FMN reductase [Xanthomonas vasicola pv. musacearum NCPPB 2005]KFA09205.1 NADPH-dependent FMN reductase [Xanthomonas vasicola pv. musacearum NCPPB 4380]KFA17381.1 NADPH-dependent FMN reductase [Xanthomonas vasicola pv. musacearum NCPPB 
MSKLTIAVLVGSLRAESYNRQLARALEHLAGDKAVFEYLEIGDIPLYNQDRDGDYPAEGTRLKQQIRAADAVLFVTPEYNRSIPGVLKNAIDTGSRPYGDSAFSGKPAAVVGISVGAIGTATAQQHLRNVLAYLNMHVLGQPEVFLQYKDGLFGADDQIVNADSRKFLQGFIDQFLDLIRHLKR